MTFSTAPNRESDPELWQAMATKQKGHVLNFAMIREYPPGVSGWGDVDSGPVIFGYGVSPSGFALAGARIFDDEDTFRGLYATTVLFETTRLGESR